MVGNLSKYFKWTPEYILWKLSYPNLVMYSATIPKAGKDDTENVKTTYVKPEDEASKLKRYL